MPYDGYTASFIGKCRYSMRKIVIQEKYSFVMEERLLSGRWAIHFFHCDPEPERYSMSSRASGKGKVWFQQHSLCFSMVCSTTARIGGSVAACENHGVLTTTWLTFWQRQLGIAGSILSETTTAFEQHSNMHVLGDSISSIWFLSEPFQWPAEWRKVLCPQLRPS